MIHQSGVLSPQREAYVDCFKHFYTSIRFWGTSATRQSRRDRRFDSRSAKLASEWSVIGVRFVTACRKPKTILRQTTIWPVEIPPTHGRSSRRDAYRVPICLSQRFASSFWPTRFPARNYSYEF